MEQVYLCHKCKGLLTACNEPEFYRCGCISGYVRDWQEPVEIGTVRLAQIRELQDRIKLYAGQGRKESDGVVMWTHIQLSRLIFGEPQEQKDGTCWCGLNWDCEYGCSPGEAS